MDQSEQFLLLLQKYVAHVVYHNGVDFLRDGVDDSEFLTKEEMERIRMLVKKEE